MRVRLGGYVIGNDSAALYRRWGYHDVCCPKDVRDAVESCPEGEELVFEINSAGGSVYQGFEMYSAIRACKRRTVAEVQGIAGSIMSVVMAACDTVVMHPVAQVMVHRASIRAAGNSETMRGAKQMLDTIDESILNAYTEKSNGKTERDAFARMMRRETFLTAQQAVDCGLADGIMQPKGKAEGNDPALAVASMGPWASMVELPPVEDLLRRERELEGGEGTDGPRDSGQPLRSVGVEELEGARPEGSARPDKNEKGVGKSMEIETKEALMEQYPELTDQIAREAAEAAGKAERERIAAIDALAMPGCEEIIARAKADPAMDAGRAAMEMIRAQKESGAAFLARREAEVQASGAGKVPAAAAPEAEEVDMEQEAKDAVALWGGG